MTDTDRSPTTGGDAWPAPEPDHRAGDTGAGTGAFGRTALAGGALDDAEPVGGLRGLLGVLGVAASIAVLAIFSIWWFVFAVGLLVSILLHELGHFSTARLTGMKATQFFIGFGPRVWSFRRGETEYGVRALPLGAFVRIIGMHAGEEVDAADRDRTYRSKPFGSRMLVICAGSLAHFILAIVILSVVYATAGQTQPVDAARVVAVSDGTPAAAAGLLPDDEVLSIGGVPVTAGGGLSAAVTAHAPGDVVDVVVARGDEVRTVDVTLASLALVGGSDDAAFLGVSARPVVETFDRAWWSSPWHAVGSLVDQTGASITGVVRVLDPTNLFSHLAGTTDDLSTRPTTLVGITAVSDDIGDSAGFTGIMEMLALLNVFVGVFNLFPLLPLDGGHAAVAIYERIREGRSGRRYYADMERLAPLTMIVVTLLLFLFMSGLYLDIVRPVG